MDWVGGKHFELLRNFSVHTRFLVAVPAFFLSELVLEERCESVLDRLWSNGVVPGADARALSRVTNVVRLCKGWHLDAFLLALALVAGGTRTGTGDGATSILQVIDRASNLTLAEVWYGAVSLTIFRFMGLHALARWLTWCAILIRLSRLDLRLVATHPDHAGGIGFLCEAIDAAALYVVGISSTLAGVWGTLVVQQGFTQKHFYVPTVVLAVVVAAATLGPLLSFSGHLYRARLRGFRSFDEFALRFVRQFERTWVGSPADQDLLEQGAVQSLADLGNSFDNLERTRPVPITNRAVTTLTLAVLLPLVPLFVADASVASVIEKLGRGLLG